MSTIVPPTTGTQLVPLSHFTNWLFGGERGISSEAIVSRLTGAPVGRTQWFSTHPHDPSDFRRCQLLLKSHMLAELHFAAMRDVSPVWARLVDAWDEIDAAIEAEVPNYLTSRADGAAPIAYRLMRRVIADGTICTKCGGTGNAEPCEKCKGSGRRGGGRCRAVGCVRGHHLCATCRGAGFTGGAH